MNSLERLIHKNGDSSELEPFDIQSDLYFCDKGVKPKNKNFKPYNDSSYTKLLMKDKENASID